MQFELESKFIINTMFMYPLHHLYYKETLIQLHE